MRVSRLIFALSLALTPQAVMAASVFDARNEAYLAREALRTVCMKHRLDRAGALAQADLDGWQSLTGEESSQVGKLYDLIKGIRLANPSIRWKPSPRGGMVLLLGDGGSAGEGCAIAFHAPFATASSVIGGHFMLPIRRYETISPAYHLWAFVEEPGKRRRAVKSYFGKVDSDLIARATANRTFATIAVIGSDTDEAALFLYSVPLYGEGAR